MSTYFHHKIKAPFAKRNYVHTYMQLTSCRLPSNKAFSWLVVLSILMLNNCQSMYL